MNSPRVFKQKKTPVRGSHFCLVVVTVSEVILTSERSEPRSSFGVRSTLDNSERSELVVVYVSVANSIIPSEARAPAKKYPGGKPGYPLCSMSGLTSAADQRDSTASPTDGTPCNGGNLGMIVIFPVNVCHQFLEGVEAKPPNVREDACILE